MVMTLFENLTAVFLWQLIHPYCLADLPPAVRRSLNPFFVALALMAGIVIFLATVSPP
jgi:hypothetical protein